MNSLKRLKTICILLLSSQSILCDYTTSLAAARRVNTKLGLNLGIDEPKMAFLVGFLERNYESYFNNPFQNVENIEYLVGDARCTETSSGCGVCNTYAPSGKNKDPRKYRSCQWGYNISWPFQYHGNGCVDRGGNGGEAACIGGSRLIDQIGQLKGNTYNITRWMWGKFANGGFNQPSASGCKRGENCWTYVMNSQANAMNFMQGVPGGADITPAEIQANFP